jgi:hypothetical protein
MTTRLSKNDIGARARGNFNKSMPTCKSRKIGYRRIGENITALESYDSTIGYIHHDNLNIILINTRYKGYSRTTDSHIRAFVSVSAMYNYYVPVPRNPQAEENLAEFFARLDEALGKCNNNRCSIGTRRMYLAVLDFMVREVKAYASLVAVDELTLTRVTAPYLEKIAAYKTSTAHAVLMAKIALTQ